jgi:DNA repair protein RecN (Recombination protein N)
MDKELEEVIGRLSYFDKIQNNLSEAYNYLDGNIAPIDQLYEAAKALETISQYDERYKENASKLLEWYYISDEIKSSIRDNLDSQDYDEDELNRSIEKMNDLSKVMDKYRKNVDDLILYLKEITISIDMAENYHEALKEYRCKVDDIFNALKINSIALSDYRKKIAFSLEDGIIKECKDLDLQNTIFKVSFNEVDYSDSLNKAIFREDGVDSIDFLISFNQGEPLKPLYKVASGGEASSIMLAFKTFFSKVSNVSLMVFDEIDTGVSGATAKKIANKLKKIVDSMQVLCITHLPQVAAIGDYHKHIYKVEENGITKTEIKDLDDKGRIEEIALMLSGDSISLYALEHARELLKKD